MDGPNLGRKNHPQRLIEVWQGEARDYMPFPLHAGRLFSPQGRAWRKQADEDNDDGPRKDTKHTR